MVGTNAKLIFIIGVFTDKNLDKTKSNAKKTAARMICLFFRIIIYSPLYYIIPSLFNFDVIRYNQGMIVVTSGSRYIDIDAYASCLAYRDLLRLQGHETVAVSTATLNESITKHLLDLPSQLDTYSPSKSDQFIILDVSNPEFFDKIVQPDSVIEIIDHHSGFEHLWRDSKCPVQISPIGAVATLIFERYESARLLDRLSPANAELLAAAILDNTLNFQAKITKQRDHDAYVKLLKIAGLTEDFAAQYFRDCQAFITSNLVHALNNDTKIERHDYPLPNIFSQLVVWDISSVIGQIDLVRKTLDTFAPHWMLNLISLSDRHSYVLTSDGSVAAEVQRLFGGQVDGDAIVLDHVWLRKEMMKRAYEDSASSAATN